MTRRGGSPRNPSRGVFMLEPQLPVRHEWLVRERDHAKLALEPFEPGFALAAGNAYRRVLLSSIHGSAPTWVKIENVLHEFSYLVPPRPALLDPWVGADLGQDRERPARVLLPPGRDGGHPRHHAEPPEGRVLAPPEPAEDPPAQGAG